MRELILSELATNAMELVGDKASVGGGSVDTITNGEVSLGTTVLVKGSERLAMRTSVRVAC